MVETMFIHLRGSSSVFLQARCSVNMELNLIKRLAQCPSVSCVGLGWDCRLLCAALCVRFIVQRISIGHLLGKVVITFESAVWGRSSKGAEARGHLFNSTVVVKLWRDHSWSQQYLFTAFSSFFLLFLFFLFFMASNTGSQLLAAMPDPSPTE